MDKKEIKEATNKYILGVEKPSFVFEKEEELNRPTEPLKVYTFSPFGYEGMVVQVETDIRKGIPAFDIVGIADSAVKETRERIRAAFSRSGLEFPSERVLQALSPADLRKVSPMDLAMALGILGTTKAYPVNGPVLALGELELSGRIRPVRGAVAAVNSAKALGITNIVCDPSTAELLKNIEGINILSAESLKEVDEKLMVAESFEKTNAVVQDTDEVQFNEKWMEDYKKALDNLPMDGHFETIRAIEIAVAGKHNILATGAPGCGKTLLTQTLMPALTPKMTQEESKVITRINSIAGLDSPKRDKLVPPFRKPHQTATIEGMGGGGPNCRPGEISLAHHGTLFMDETAEFRSSVIQMLRVPLESRQITLSRAGRSTSYPADFQLAMAMNPCPCGCYGSKDKICLDSARSIEQYWKKISDPILDRVEIKTFVQKDMNDTRKVSIEQMKASIKKAYEIQRKRGVYNSHMTPEQIQMYCKLDKESQAYLDKEEEKLTPRGKANLLKLSLTIANMDGREEIRINDIKEARELSAPVFEKPKQYVYNPEQNEEVVVSINNDTYLTKKVESVIELANPDNLTESKDEAALLKRYEAEFIVDVLNRDKAKYNLKSEFGIESSEVHEEINAHLINQIHNRTVMESDKEYSNDKVLTSLHMIDKVMKYDGSMTINNPGLGDVIYANGTIGNIEKARNGGFGIKHIIEGRYLKDNMSNEDITSLLHLIKDTVETVEPEVSEKNRINLQKNGIWVGIAKSWLGTDENWIVTGFGIKEENQELTKEAIDSIKAVSAQYGYAPEFLSISKQVGAITSNIDNTIRNIKLSNDSERINNFRNIYKYSEVVQNFFEMDVHENEASEVDTRLFPSEGEGEKVKDYSAVHKVSLPAKFDSGIFKHDFMVKNNFYPPFVSSNDGKYIVRCKQSDLVLENENLKETDKIDLELSSKQFAETIATHKVYERITRYKQSVHNNTEPVPIVSNAAVINGKVCVGGPTIEQKSLIMEKYPELAGNNKAVKDEYKKIAGILAEEVAKYEPIIDVPAKEQELETEKNQDSDYGY